ncbi:MAG: hypothetical protein ACXW1D_00640 [Halobacteriota archaeon]
MEYKVCSKCKDNKSLTLFNKSVEKRSGYKSNCKSCESASRSRRLSDPDKRSQERDRIRNRRANQTEQQRRAYNDKCLDYYARNKSDYRKRVMDRIAKKNMATPKWADTEWEQFVIREIYHLASLRQEMLGVELHVDHTVPLQSDIVCGLHCSANLEVVTAKYNRAKGNHYWKDMP